MINIRLVYSQADAQDVLPAFKGEFSSEFIRSGVATLQAKLTRNLHFFYFFSVDYTRRKVI